MKKIVSLAFGMIASFSAIAQQNAYTFSQTTEPYQELTGAISINNGQNWNTVDEIGPIATPFTINLFGQSFNTFYFTEGMLTFENNTSEGIIVPNFITGYDRGGGSTQTQSPIAYRVDGTQGNRIWKVQFSNIGVFSMQTDTPQPSNQYINSQVWYYESDGSIEYRYGNVLVQPTNLFNSETHFWVPIFGVFNDEMEEGAAGHLFGTASAPTYAEINEAVDDPNGLTTPVVANTVYRFTPNPLSVKDYEKVTFNIYPNPVENVLTITFNEPIQKDYAIYDIVGRLVTSGAIDNKQSTQIDVSSLEKGNYILRIGGSSKNIIKK
ncbi:T9SS type A sorting domain-containing protein [Capnocytophaga sp. ARDL2]|uniref:T9SS type A sorting domain-containing protein n=1 Tax=Capnocytophaga sp. ARDL2 TaxID=3238809 RepID=UPI0035588D7D